MKTRVQKWGNSLALRLPKSLAQSIQIEQGTVVDLSVAGGELSVRPLAESAFSLKGLLSQISKKNIHREIDSGPPQGNEIG